MADLFYTVERMVFVIQLVGLDLGIKRKFTNNNGEGGRDIENFDRKETGNVHCVTSFKKEGIYWMAVIQQDTVITQRPGNILQ